MLDKYELTGNRNLIGCMSILNVDNRYHIAAFGYEVEWCNEVAVALSMFEEMVTIWYFKWAILQLN